MTSGLVTLPLALRWKFDAFVACLRRWFAGSHRLAWKFPAHKIAPRPWRSRTIAVPDAHALVVLDQQSVPHIFVGRQSRRKLKSDLYRLGVDLGRSTAIIHRTSTFPLGPMRISLDRTSDYFLDVGAFATITCDIASVNVSLLASEMAGRSVYRLRHVRRKLLQVLSPWLSQRLSVLDLATAKAQSNQLQEELQAVLNDRLSPSALRFRIDALRFESFESFTLDLLQHAAEASKRAGTRLAEYMAVREALQAAGLQHEFNLKDLRSLFKHDRKLRELARKKETDTLRRSLAKTRHIRRVVTSVEIASVLVLLGVLQALTKVDNRLVPFYVTSVISGAAATIVARLLLRLGRLTPWPSVIIGFLVLATVLVRTWPIGIPDPFETVAWTIKDAMVENGANIVWLYPLQFDRPDFSLSERIAAGLSNALNRVGASTSGASTVALWRAGTRPVASAKVLRLKGRADWWSQESYDYRAAIRVERLENGDWVSIREMEITEGSQATEYPKLNVLQSSDDSDRYLGFGAGNVVEGRTPAEPDARCPKFERACYLEGAKVAARDRLPPGALVFREVVIEVRQNDFVTFLSYLAPDTKQ